MAYNVHDIANKIILHTDSEKGDIISNLKLQKLLYYMQGYHLAFFDDVLFESPLEAWMYGPVSPDVYHRFKENKNMGLILDPKDCQEVVLSTEQEEMFKQVMREYGKFSAIRLMEMTHDEAPWREAFEKPGSEISVDKMKNFFKELVYE